MTKEQLSQYIDLQAEQQENLERIKKIEGQIDKLTQNIIKIREEGTVIDSVTGGEGGIQRFKIEGFPNKEYGEKVNRLEYKKKELQELKHELEQRNEKIKPLLKEIHKFMYNIDDSHTFRIVRMRYEDGKSWQQIAMLMGGGNSADSVRKQVERFLKN